MLVEICAGAVRPAPSAPTSTKIPLAPAPAPPYAPQIHALRTASALSRAASDHVVAAETDAEVEGRDRCGGVLSVLRTTRLTILGWEVDGS